LLRIVEEAARTDTGRQRRANEDAYLARAPMFVVADGMGGAEAGEVASKIATEMFDDQADLNDPERLMAERAREANRRIFEFSRGDEARAGMGTTLTAAALVGDEISLAHVGDSRAYLFRDGSLRQLTRDHSLVEELRRQGRLTSEEAEEHPQRSVITRALGPEPDVDLDLQTHQARSGDVYLLCSDGLTSMVREERLVQILASAPTLRDAVDRMVSEANDAGGRDNITVVCFRIGGESDRSVANDMEDTSTSLNVRDLQAALEAGDATQTAASGDRPPAAERSVWDGPGRPAHGPARPARGRRWLRRTLVAALVLILLAGAAAGATLGVRSAYFIGADEHGLVTLYRGVPYELPGGVRLYSEHYVSSVPVRGLAPVQRQRLLDHQLRSRNDAVDLVRRLERGEAVR
jgi:serine/threonine protein phosphatase PrpC